jgi:uncharacterized protein YndB with AHSA1/START domain
MKIALIVIGVIVVLVVAVILIGMALPVKHRAQVEAHVNASPDAVFTLITDVEAFPKWRAGLKSVELLPASPDGKRRFKEVSSDGAITFVMETVEPPKKLVSRIDDKSLPFGGTWTYELIPSGAQTTLRITEDGEVYNPFFRFVSKYVMGHESTIRKYLASVQRRFGGSG